jgi:hypothetical protein
MLVFFGWVIWFWLLIAVFSDLFRRHDISGWGKAGWTLIVVVLPYLGVFIYMIAQGAPMAERRAAEMQARGGNVRDAGATDQIAQGKELLDSGAINAAEFEQIKQRALAQA